MATKDVMRAFQLLWVAVAAGALAALGPVGASQGSSVPGTGITPMDVRSWGSDVAGTTYQGEPLAGNPSTGAVTAQGQDSPMDTDAIPQGTTQGIEETGTHGLVAYGDTRVPFGALARSGDADLYLRSDNPQMGRLHALTNPRNDHSTTTIPAIPGVPQGPDTTGNNSTGGGPQGTGGGTDTTSRFVWKSVAHGKLLVLVPAKVRP